MISNTIFNAVEDNVKKDLSLTEMNIIRSDNKAAQKPLNHHILKWQKHIR